MSFKVKDHYFHKAKKENFLARSVYKLEEIDQRFKILKPKMNVIDLGYHPGSWIQYTAKVVGPQGSVIGIDLKPVQLALANLSNVKLFQLDAFEMQTLEAIHVKDHFDVVLSDMAPNTSGNKTVDQLRSLALVEKVFEMLTIFLQPKGSLVIKVFDGHDVQIFLKTALKRFEESHYLRPKSTRTTSKEFFVIAKKFKA